LKISESLKDMFLDKDVKSKIKFLSEISIFNNLDPIMLGRIINIAYSKTYKKGEIIFSEGEIAKAIFIVASGSVEFTRKISEKEEGILFILSPGDFFGEMALLEESPRSSTARAIEDSEIYIIYKVNFDGLIDRYPQVGLKIIKNLAAILSKRLRKTRDQVAAQIMESLDTK
jgi:CRP-like cAMP-binding protein